VSEALSRAQFTVEQRAAFGPALRSVLVAHGLVPAITAGEGE
jgi:hypothetical protein